MKKSSPPHVTRPPLDRSYAASMVGNYVVSPPSPRSFAADVVSNDVVSSPSPRSYARVVGSGFVSPSPVQKPHPPGFPLGPSPGPRLHLYPPLLSPSPAGPNQPQGEGQATVPASSALYHPSGSGSLPPSTGLAINAPASKIPQLPIRQLQWAERAKLRLPPTHQLLLLDNPSQKECYSNAGTVSVLSNPLIAGIVANLTASDDLVKILRALSLLAPDRVANLRSLRSRVADYLPGFRVFREVKEQQDAHEWVVALLHALESALVATGNHREVKALRSSMQTTITRKRECAHFGSLHCSESKDVETILSLPVLHPQTNQMLASLEECLHHFLEPETLEMRCANCSCSHSIQYSTITEQAPVLFLHLKRFNNKGQKISKNIKFGSNLQLRPDLDPYLLTCALLHTGTTVRSGHYSCVVRCCVTGHFFYTSDRNVPRRLVDQAELVHHLSEAYMLVYSDKAATLDVSTPVSQHSLGPQVGAAGDAVQVGLQQGELGRVTKREGNFSPRQRQKLQRSSTDCEAAAAKVDLQGISKAAQISEDSVPTSCSGAKVTGRRPQQGGAEGTGKDGHDVGGQQGERATRPGAQRGRRAAQGTSGGHSGLGKAPSNGGVCGRSRGRGRRGGRGRCRGADLVAGSASQPRQAGGEHGDHLPGERSNGGDDGASGNHLGGASPAPAQGKKAQKSAGGNRSFTDDFQPSDDVRNEMMAAIESRETYLRERIRRLQRNNFSWVGLPPNPLHEGILKMEEELRKLNFVYCRHCDEQLFAEKLSRRDQRCRKCHAEWQNSKPGQVLMWSPENDMRCTEVPPELQGLTPVEQSAIQRLFPIMKIYRVSQGALYLKGHCLTVLQDLEGFAMRLPPVPSSLPMIFLIGPGQRVS